MLKELEGAALVLLVRRPPVLHQWPNLALERSYNCDFARI